MSQDAYRSRKRRAEEVDDEHHGEFDANELRQHEEFTKVKNVDSVELGQYQMETWYFSPLPAEYNNCKVSSALRLLTRYPSLGEARIDGFLQARAFSQAIAASLEHDSVVGRGWMVRCK